MAPTTMMDKTKQLRLLVKSHKPTLSQYTRAARSISTIFTTWGTSTSTGFCSTRLQQTLSAVQNFSDNSANYFVTLTYPGHHNVTFSRNAHLEYWSFHTKVIKTCMERSSTVFYGELSRNIGGFAPSKRWSANTSWVLVNAASKTIVQELSCSNWAWAIVYVCATCIRWCSTDFTCSPTDPHRTSNWDDESWSWRS